MAVPPSTQLQSKLQAAVQSVQWTYSLFWKICPQEGVLVWAEGYYNGAIKTRKTVQPMEVSTEEASLQRSQQLKELYESLSAGETNQQTRRPSAALSPEDLTESEWFYLMCVSFSFPPGVGLPGKAYARRQHIWLTGAADEPDSKAFCRAILAKSASIQTVVCIPLLDGVVELGTTDKVEEDLAFVNHIKSFFADHHHHHPQPPKPALSEHSTSNPTASANHSLFHSPPLPSKCAAPLEDEEPESDSEEDTGRNMEPEQGERGELMQLDLPEEIRLGSPDDVSNNFDYFAVLAASHSGQQGRAGTSGRWGMMQDMTVNAAFQQPVASELLPLEDWDQEDSHYSQTLSAILQSQPNWAHPSPALGYLPFSSNSAFSKWAPRPHPYFHGPTDGPTQWTLKSILLAVPFVHNKCQDGDWAATRFRKQTPQDELSANHVIPERCRRQNVNERFVILRSLIPFVTKMDKASILGDTIEYLKEMRKKIQELEAWIHEMEVERRSKKKPRVAGAANTAETSVEVSIIEGDALVEMECPYREGLLLDAMTVLREMSIEVTSCQSRLKDGFFTAELRAKVKDNFGGRKVSIVEVKRAINRLKPGD